jgi:non-ribosomal peptide synthetase component E (peptide arylation enzyme)
VIDARGLVTYGDLRERADRCALALLDLGVYKGDTVPVQLPNWSEFVVVSWRSHASAS